MYIREPFKNATDSSQSDLPIVLAVDVEQDQIRVLFRGVGSIRHLQYVDIENSRHWRDEGFDCSYSTGSNGFHDKEEIDPTLALGMDDFVMTIKGNDLERVLMKFQNMGLVTYEQHHAAAKQFYLVP